MSVSNVTPLPALSKTFIVDVEVGGVVGDDVGGGGGGVGGGGGDGGGFASYCHRPTCN